MGHALHRRRELVPRIDFRRRVFFDDAYRSCIVPGTICVMTGGPDWLYPSRRRDRGLRARAVRAIDRAQRRMRKRVPPLLRIVSEIQAATGEGRLGIARDVVANWLRDGVDPRVFAAQALFDLPPERRREFIFGRELDAFLTRTLVADDRDLMRDKAGFAAHARRAGVPCPVTLAVINRREKPSIDDALSIDAPEKLASALEDLTSGAAVFLKPSVGKQGHGVFRVAHGGRALDADGCDVPLATLVEQVFAYRHPVGAYGYLVQPALDSHHELVALTGVDALATLRVITAMRGGKSETVRAFLKIPAPGRLTNNFLGGVSGSLLSPVDLESGRLGKLAGLLRPRSRYVIERTSTHPVTGRRIEGAELPAWRDALTIAERGAELFQRTATLGWDLALARSGWTVLEVNTMWGAGGPQAASHSGLRPDLARLFPEHWRARG